MKVNDIVKVHDGSYNMALVKGKLEHIHGVYHQCRRYRVLGVSGTYPTDDPFGTAGDNDTMLIDVDDHDFVLFTQERFCSIMHSPAVPPTHVEIVVPRGAKEIHLILQ